MQYIWIWWWSWW